MRIGLIDVDKGTYPNLVLMKLSAYHKEQGDEVEWYVPFTDRYDRVYLSKVFSFTPDYDLCINADEVVRGGSGYAIKMENGKEVFDHYKNAPLPSYIEHIYPDYSLYPNNNSTAYGFLTRGCPRGCGFCIVGEKEGRKSVKVADLNEFWKGLKNIVLYDPNFLACKEWKNLLEQLEASSALIDFNQGLDIRMMTEEKAEMLSRLRMKEIHFAWDRYEDKEMILPKFKMFHEITSNKFRAKDAIVMTIVNYSTTFEQDLDRIYTLRDIGYWPYVMVYDKAHCDRKYRSLQRWVNNRYVFDKVKRFEDYRPV